MSTFEFKYRIRSKDNLKLKDANEILCLSLKANYEDDILEKLSLKHFNVCLIYVLWTVFTMIKGTKASKGKTKWNDKWILHVNIFKYFGLMTEWMCNCTIAKVQR